jgi:predicted transposase YbfD/YdcC
LLRCLALAGCVLSIDAMGCQREIAQQILNQDGAYVLALKDNQEPLQADVQLSVTVAQADDFVGVRHDRAQTIEKGHGRIETRHALVIDDPAVLA